MEGTLLNTAIWSKDFRPFSSEALQVRHTTLGERCGVVVQGTAL